MPQISLLNAEQPPVFPPVEMALEEPNGLLAIGGQLSPPWLLMAYQNGIFPWFSDGEPIMWWSPTPRMVLAPGEAHISRTTLKQFRRNPVEIQVNQNFESVIRHCASNKLRSDGTWITEEMVQAYCQLHRDGWAHSFEVYDQGNLAGGLYGIGMDSVFFGESMFSLSSGASKYAFIALSEWAFRSGLRMIDCQLHNDYLASMGATLINRKDFTSQLPSTQVELNLDNVELVNQFFIERMQSGCRNNEVQ